MPPSLPEAAWINKPKVESTAVTVADNQSIPEVSGLMSGEGIVFPRSAIQLYGNDTKFESEVSQRH